MCISTISFPFFKQSLHLTLARVQLDDMMSLRNGALIHHASHASERDQNVAGNLVYCLRARCAYTRMAYSKIFREFGRTALANVQRYIDRRVDVHFVSAGRQKLDPSKPIASSRDRNALESSITDPFSDQHCPRMVNTSAASAFAQHVC